MKNAFFRLFCLLIPLVMLLSACTPAMGTSSQTSPEEEPPKPVNELREALAKDCTVILQKDPMQFTQMQASSLVASLRNAGYAVSQRSERKSDYPEPEEGSSQEEPATVEPEEYSPVSALHFGKTQGTPEELYAALGTADFTVSRDAERIYVTGGSDYALQKAAELFVSLLTQEELSLPYTYTAPQLEQVGFLRVATFNIQNGAAVNHIFKSMAKYVADLELDIVGLQEVDMNTARNSGKDTMKELSELTGMEYYGFSKAIALGGGEYGSGVLSRYPIVSYDTIALPGGGGDESRSMGHAVIDENGVRIDFFNTHLTLRDEYRDKQWQVIAPMFSASAAAIVTGDFNRDGTEDYDRYFAQDCSYANGNNRIGFEEGCRLIAVGADPAADQEAQEEIVRSLYALKNGESLPGEYTLTGKITGVVNLYSDSEDVTFRIVVGSLAKQTVKCFKLTGEGVSSLKPGDVVTVQGTLTNKTCRSALDDTPCYFDSCPGYGALDNVIAGRFFTQMAWNMEVSRRTLSDHNLLWSYLAYPSFVPAEDPATQTPSGEDASTAAPSGTEA